MKKDIEQLLHKKTTAISTTESEIQKLDTNIERKERIIAKAELEIENQRAAIEDKLEKRAELEHRASFQTERVEALQRYVDESEALEAELEGLYERKDALSDWGTDLARMRADKGDPESEWSKVSARIEEIYKEQKRLMDFANFEYNMAWIR